MRTWLLLVYKVPSEPTARRVYVWRKLKRLGAVLQHDSVWVLPAAAWTREQLQWLAVEIGEMGGTATLWESRMLLAGQEDGLVREFEQQAEAHYAEILKELEREDADVPALARKYQQVRSQDYFRSELGQQAYRAIMEARGVDSG